MIYNLRDIKHLHVELSSRCNAACPKCPRNFYGYPYNAGYEEHDMSLEEAQHIFPPVFLQQLSRIDINGNFGDVVMSLHTLDIVEYFKRWVPTSTNINISTNGGARDRVFWTKLAELDIEVFFCLDGLEDTHHLYRQNTLFSTVIKNAKTFIDAGGRAGWKMIMFEHNQHQVNSCRQLSKDLGFNHFITMDQGRDYGPVYNSIGELVHVMKPNKWPGSTDFKTHFDVATMPEKQWSPTFREKKIREWTGEIKPIACEVKKTKSIYVSSIGDVYPCCYMGFSPKTFKNHDWLGWANTQVAKLIFENNALEHDLEHCMQWFTKVSESWEKTTNEEGRLSICNQTCGVS
jgi:MoaA/NifB/PqqE/SkfB family radical SAM enzyme